MVRPAAPAHWPYAPSSAAGEDRAVREDQFLEVAVGLVGPSGLYRHRVFLADLELERAELLYDRAADLARRAALHRPLPDVLAVPVFVEAPPRMRIDNVDLVEDRDELDGARTVEQRLGGMMCQRR